MADSRSQVSDGELSDVEEAPNFALAEINLQAIGSPTVLRAFAAICVSLLVLLWPDRSSVVVGRLIGVGLIAGGGTALMMGLPRHRRDFVRSVGGLVLVALGAWLMLRPGQSDGFLGRLLAGVLFFVAAKDMVQIRSQDQAARAWTGVRSVAMLATAGFLFVLAEAVFAGILTVAALLAMLLSIGVVVASLDPSTPNAVSYRDSLNLVWDWLSQRSKSVDDRQDLYQKILYEGPTLKHRVVRFFALMGFASVIASTGVIADSTAVVIGAMLIAPLMTPLMGMAISLVMGWPRRLTRSTVLALTGIGFAIVIGLFIGLTSPAVIETAVNSQIVGRSSPTILDLLTAMAAGAAGAYGLSRPDVADSLPGVAIAISLVPPLTVVGIALSQGDIGSASGALLLFLTNMLAILIVGGLTFVVTGVTPLRQVAENQHRVRTSLGAIATLAVVVLGALLLNGAQIATNVAQQSTIETTIADWLGANDSGHQVANINTSDEAILVTVIGPSDGLGSVRSLAQDLAVALDRSVAVDVRLVVEERQSAQAEP